MTNLLVDFSEPREAPRSQRVEDHNLPTFYGLRSSAVDLQVLEVLRLRARDKVKSALRTGQIRKPAACEYCGLPGELEADHRDYCAPLAVRWVHRACHAAITRKDREEARVILAGLRGAPAWVALSGSTSVSVTATEVIS